MQEKKSGLTIKLEKWLNARRAKKEILPEDKVRLPDFMGFKPGVYLTCIYALVLVIILFFVLVHPGIAHPGAVVVFETEPSGAALRVDGLYMGTSPGKIFVPKGKHQLEIILPDFEPQTIECEIPGRLFASALFPRKYPLKVELECPAPVTVVRDAARDYADWTFGGEPTADWQIPLSLSEGIYRVGNNGNRAAIDDVICAAARFAGTRAALRDLSRAKALNDNGGLSPSPVSLYHSATNVLRFLSDNPRSAEWLGSVLPSDMARSITKSAWYQKIETTQNEASYSAGNSLPRTQLSLAGLSFTSSNGRADGQFLLCDTPVTIDAYNLFVAAHGFWAAESTELLVENGLAAANYLHDDRPARAKVGTENIQTAVSWFAAVDFCEWLTGRLPAVMNDYEVRLPRESEWDYVNRVTANAARADIESNIWEWCADPFAPVNVFSAKTNYIEWLGSLERSLRGFPIETRTSLPANFCSAFVSFRPVIALKEIR